MTASNDSDLEGRRRAKIICTLGPTTDSEGVLKQLIRNGMDSARLNLSFGPLDDHIERIRQLRSVSNQLTSRPVSVIADIPGRKLRIGRLAGKTVQLKTGNKVTLVNEKDQVGDSLVFSMASHFFHDNLAKGHRILLSDGVVELVVTRVGREEVESEVVYGGLVSERTAVHIPGIRVDPEPLTPRDLQCLQMAVDQKVDYVALTYMANGSEILHVRKKLAALGRDIPIITKIERSEAFARLEEILKHSNAVMVRRGDLGAQIEINRIPLIQKKILQSAKEVGVPVIIATQMLGSMIASPRPTRAEASDVSNAVADGADGVLLSGETAIGQYPIESVDMMARIIAETEREQIGREKSRDAELAPAPFPETTAVVACRAAQKTKAKLIACFTESGRTAQLVARYRPAAPIIAFCPNAETRRFLTINWGLRTAELDSVQDVDEMVERVQARLVALRLINEGDRLVIVFGAPVGKKGHTNSVRLHEVRNSANTQAIAADA